MRMRWDEMRWEEVRRGLETSGDKWEMWSDVLLCFYCVQVRDCETHRKRGTAGAQHRIFVLPLSEWFPMVLWCFGLVCFALDNVCGRICIGNAAGLLLVRLSCAGLVCFARFCNPALVKCIINATAGVLWWGLDFFTFGRLHFPLRSLFEIASKSQCFCLAAKW